MSGLSLKHTNLVAEREESGAVVHLKDEFGKYLFYTNPEGGDPLPVTVRVLGTFSHTYRRAQNEQRERLLAERRKARDNDDEDDVISGERLEFNQFELMAKCTRDWNGVVDDEGKLVAVGTSMAHALIASAPWLRAQIEPVMLDHERFFNAA